MSFQSLKQKEVRNSKLKQNEAVYSSEMLLLPRSSERTAHSAAPQAFSFLVGPLESLFAV